MPKLTARRLRALLNYSPRTGRFTWRIDRGFTARTGTVAGAIKSNRYRYICVDYVQYLTSRLAVLYMTGRWPKRIVDHINGNKADDRWLNHREADYSQNAANGRIHKDKQKSAFKGVFWDKNRNKYLASIGVNYRIINLGRFDTAEEAHAAYVTAAKKYFGEFARVR